MSDSRPNPLADTAKRVGAIWALASGVVGALGAFGVLSVAQADAIAAAGAQLPASILALGALVGAVVPLVTSLVAAFHTAAAAKSSVTPVSSPQDNHGNALVPVNTTRPGQAF